MAPRDQAEKSLAGNIIIPWLPDVLILTAPEMNAEGTSFNLTITARSRMTKKVIENFASAGIVTMQTTGDAVQIATFDNVWTNGVKVVPLAITSPAAIITLTATANETTGSLVFQNTIVHKLTFTGAYSFSDYNIEWGVFMSGEYVGPLEVILDENNSAVIPNAFHQVNTGDSGGPIPIGDFTYDMNISINEYLGVWQIAFGLFWPDSSLNAENSSLLGSYHVTNPMGSLSNFVVATV
jgi:hypothetical protein